MTALAGWAREHATDLGDGVGQSAAAAFHELGEHVATGAPECQWCPVCRAIRAWRETSPEVRAHLTAAASSSPRRSRG
ncbi:MAG: hypothetical protein R2731_16815 [Nocardioides sp.]